MARSTSASVVDVSDTLIRIARRPCQMVPPIHASPLACTRSITASVSSSVPKDTSTWLSAGRTQHLSARVGECCREALGVSTALFDRRGDAVTAEGRKDRPHGDRPGRLRHLESEVHRTAAAVAACVGGVHAHRCAERGRVGDGDDAAVVGGVQPLVTVGRPRVGEFDAGRAGGDVPGRRSPTVRTRRRRAPTTTSRSSRSMIAPNGSLWPVFTLPA